MKNQIILGFLRETEDLCKKAKKEFPSKEFSPMMDYLKIIYPQVDDWVCDKRIPDSGSIIRPDFRSESLKLIIEIDGVVHYTDPNRILKDANNNSQYEKLGYKVIRIPYFIQLTREVISELFGINFDEDLFPVNVPSIGIGWDYGNPKYLCFSGLEILMMKTKEFYQILQSSNSRGGGSILISSHVELI